MLLSMSAPDGVLFEYLDDNYCGVHRLTIQEFADAWNQGVPFGTPLPQQAA